MEKQIPERAMRSQVAVDTAVIGKADKFYTLWYVSEPVKKYVSKHEYYVSVFYDYRQNLALNKAKAIDKAKRMTGQNEVVVDEELRGKTASFWANKSERQSDVADGRFKFGRYINYPYSDAPVDYLQWYGNEVTPDSRHYDEELPKAMKAAGMKYLEDTKTWCSAEEYEEALLRIARNDYMKSLKGGLHEEDGAKVSIYIREIDTFSFQGMYGTTYVQTFADAQGRKFKYVGSRPKAIDTFDSGKFTFIKATIKHSDYNGEFETKLLRIKVVGMGYAEDEAKDETELLKS